MSALGSVFGLLPDLSSGGADIHDDEIHALEFDIGILFVPEREARTTAAVLQSRFASCTRRECALYISVICLFLAQALTFHEGLP
jgi:hypothetical protein